MESDAYFTTVAPAWDGMRAGYFTAAMRDAALAFAGLSGAHPAAVFADVGTGTGFVLQGLLASGARLVGFDENAAMLAQARRNLAGHPRVSLYQADGRRLPAGAGAFDAVCANMYLHHAPHPAAAVAELARVLRPGGQLLITDLDRHDQAWMRSAMADRWLGFARADVSRWLAAAGLTEVTIDCASGTCDCAAPGGHAIALSIFMARGRQPKAR